MPDLTKAPVQRNDSNDFMSSPLGRQDAQATVQQQSSGHFANNSPQVQQGLQLQTAANSFVGGNTPRQFKAPKQLFASPVQMKLDAATITQLGMDDIGRVSNINLSSNKITSAWMDKLNELNATKEVVGGKSMENWMKLFIVMEEVARSGLLDTTADWLTTFNANEREARLDDFLDSLQDQIGMKVRLMAPDVKNMMKTGSSFFAGGSFMSPLEMLGKALKEIQCEEGFRIFVEGSFGGEEWAVGKVDRLMDQYLKQASRAHLPPFVQAYLERTDSVTLKENKFAMFQAVQNLLIEEMAKIGLDTIIDFPEIPEFMILGAMRRRAGDIEDLRDYLNRGEEFLDEVEAKMKESQYTYPIDENAAVKCMKIGNAGDFWNPAKVLAGLQAAKHPVDDPNDVGEIYEALKIYLVGEEKEEAPMAAADAKDAPEPQGPGPDAKAGPAQGGDDNKE